jgi:hypothetical protein
MSLETDYFPAARIITNTKLPDLQSLKIAQKMNSSDIDYARQIFQRITNALRGANLELSEQSKLTLSPQKSRIYLGKITAQSQEGTEISFSAHLMKLDVDKNSIDLVAEKSLDKFCASYSKNEAAQNNKIFKEILDRVFQALEEATVAYATRTILPFIPAENSDARSLTQQLLHAPYLTIKDPDETGELPSLDSFSRQRNGRIIEAHTPQPGATFVYHLEENSTLAHYRELAFLLNRIGVKNSFYSGSDT